MLLNNNKNTAIGGVLFDLDGTLLDTAPDLTNALNRLREKEGLPALCLSKVRSIVSLGSAAMLKYAFNVDKNTKDFNRLREDFLAFYQLHLADSTKLFPDMEKVLSYLEEQKITWGIVTNKYTTYTIKLLKALELDHRPACIVCGDSLTTFKPDPAPIRYACELLKQSPADCLYVGDAFSDVIASKAAGTKSVVALYGYIDAEHDPHVWQADEYIREPLEIIKLLENFGILK